MRALIQRVTRAAVDVEGERIAQIGPGLLILLGVGQHDTEVDAQYLAGKVADLRIFPDQQGKMGRSLKDVGGEALVVSQVTLYGDCRRGRRPDLTAAAPPQRAVVLYELFAALLAQQGIEVRLGRFGAYMQVELINDGPVTLWLESPRNGGM